MEPPLRRLLIASSQEVLPGEQKAHREGLGGRILDGPQEHGDRVAALAVVMRDHRGELLNS
jgi:hypothetical protein